MGSNRNEKSPARGLIGGVLLAFALSFALVALSALLLYKQVIGENLVTVIDPIIKAASALLAGLVGSRGFSSKRWLFGALAALIYIVLSLLVFQLLSGGISLSKGMLTDLLMCAFSGMAGGVIGSLSSPAR